MQEEQKQYEKKNRPKDVPEKDVDLNEDKSNETEHEVKVEGEFLKSLSFRQRMRVLPPHHLPMKDQMKDKTISYMNFLRPGPPPSESSSAERSNKK